MWKVDALAIRIFHSEFLQVPSDSQENRLSVRNWKQSLLRDPYGLKDISYPCPTCVCDHFSICCREAGDEEKGTQVCRDQIDVDPTSSSAALGPSVVFSEPQFSHLSAGASSTLLMGFL